MGKGLPILAAFSLLSLNLITPQELQADQLTAPRILILPFTNSTGDRDFDALRDGMSDLLVSGFSQFEDLILVGREHLDQVAQELGLSVSSAIGRSQSIIVATRVGANRLITGELTRAGDQITIEAHVFDVATTQRIASHRLSGEVVQAAALASGVARKIFASLGLDSGNRRRLPLDQQPGANLHFIQGLGYYYAKLYNHAIAEFMQALDLNGNSPEARFWIAKSYYADRSLDHARIELRKFETQFATHGLGKEVDALLASMKSP